MNNVEHAITLFEYWRKRLKIKKIPFKQDNRYSGHFVSHFENYKPVKVTYNTSNLKEWNYPLIVNGIFHEIGHIKMSNHPYDTVEERVEEEYLAEQYAIDMMKKHYEVMLKPCISYMKNKLTSQKWRSKYPIHYQAFSQIKEYMI